VRTAICTAARGLGCRGPVGWPARPGARCRGSEAGRQEPGRTEAGRLPSLVVAEGGHAKSARNRAAWP